MADIEHFYPIISDIEGGFSNDPDDDGKETYRGVTIATFRSVFGKDKTVQDLRNMTEAQWRYIYRIYWDSCNADKINNQSIAELVVDWSINSGVDGRKGVQKIFNLVQDGIFGPKTLGALNGSPAKCIFCKIMDARIQFYKDLVARKPSQKKFLNGWLNNRLPHFTFVP